MSDREWPKLPKDEAPEATKEAGLSDEDVEHDLAESERLDVDEGEDAQ